jgi:multiple sugar transport system substrate-binding protein
MKKKIALLLAAALTVGSLSACGGGNESAPEATAAKGGDNGSAAQGGDGGQSAASGTVYPAGTLTVYAMGNPQYRQQYFETWLENHRDIAPDVKIEFVQTEGTADIREKITMTALSGATEDLPDAAMLDPVTIMDLANAGLLKDETEYLTPLLDKMVDGAAKDATIDGKIYALPDSVRPQVLFYNKEIFDQYGIDPEMMKTMDGYIEAGRQLKEKSGGEVFLSYIDPTSKTWRYWGRRGLMPSADAKIWDDSGEVIIGSDEGTKKALGALDTMNSEGLLMKTTIMEPALYDAINNQKVATFCIGAFWDEFMRQNCDAVKGQWRVMSAPEFEGVQKAGAPVSQYMGIIEKGDNPYSELFRMMWYDFTFDIDAKEEWVNSMEAQNAPYSNPVSIEMLEDPFWKEPSEFYGGMSFREMEGKCLQNGADNLIVTPQDAEADEIISAELEKYVAGNQSMEEAIANMDKNLKAKIGKAQVN